MKFLFDIGNTQCKCAVWDDGVIEHCFTSAAQKSTDIDLSQISHFKPDAIWVSSVRIASFNDAFADQVKSCFSVTAEFAQTVKSACGITTVYDSMLGIDRFLALIAAWREFHSGCIVVDCGTAVTIDVLDHDGIHQGGVIMPGLIMLAESLERNADQLPASSLGQDDILYATNTRDAITSGCRNMWLYGITETVKQMGKTLDISLVVVTGGDGNKWEGVLAKRRNGLVMEGLAAIFTSDQHE